MTALALRASQALSSPPLALFSRVIAAAATLVEVFAEAQRQASEAHRKFPFGDW